MLKKTCLCIFGSHDPQVLSNTPIYINNTQIAQVLSIKYLGVFIDSSLNWYDHIDFIYNKLLKFVAIFHKLQHFLPFYLMKSLYFTLVHPTLLYGIEVYANTYTSHLKRLMTLNNYLIRIILKANIRCPIKLLYSQMNTLPLTILHNFQILVFMHRFVHYSNQLPEIFTNYFDFNKCVHNYNTRNADCLHLMSVTSVKGSRSIKFKGVQLWNSLPENIRNIKSTGQFKATLKKYYLDNLSV